MTTNETTPEDRFGFLPRCGDVVETLHPVTNEPTGTRLLVAYADPERNALAETTPWCEWPTGTVRLDQVRIVRRCSDEEHRRAVEKWAVSERTEPGGRRSEVLRLYAPELYLQESFRDAALAAEVSMREFLAKLAELQLLTERALALARSSVDRRSHVTTVDTSASSA